MIEDLSFEELAAGLLDDSQALSYGALGMLSGMLPDESKEFLTRVSRASAERRRQLVRSLVELAESSIEMDFGVIFRYCLDDEDAGVREAALEGLWEDESPALANTLVGILRADGSVAVRAAAASSLGRFAYLAEMEELDAARSEAVKEALLAVIHDRDEDVEVRRRAIESIAFLSVDGLRAIIDAAYGDDDPRMQVSAIYAMGRSADPFWMGTVVSELTNEDPECRYEAARACGELGARDAVPALSRLMGDRDREVQAAAIWALGQIGGDKARRLLMECCEADDEMVQDAADEALAELELGATPLDLIAVELGDDLESDDEVDWDLQE
jgi:HEAT repeat protein